MPKKIQIEQGTKFGMLTTEGEAESIRDLSGASVRMVHCLCDCGNKATVRLAGLRQGKTKSCGCYRVNKMKTHGMYKTREYRAWSHMKDRCLNITDKNYHRYGGRGITISDDWMQFECFYKDMGTMPKWASLDRIDNDSGYSNENCRWATEEQQMNNTRRCIVVEYKGKSQTISQWAKETGIRYGNIRHRFAKGLPLDKVFSQVCLK